MQTSHRSIIEGIAVVEQSVATEHLRFSPEILARLGEELIPHPDQGIIELVRNAYDADAVNCKIQLNNTDRQGGSIGVSDDGEGLSLDAIKAGWLLIGRSSKSPRRRTRLGRLPVGDKGLGRLAALRMGTKAILRTRPKAEPGAEYRVTLDWDKFDNATFVESVPLVVKKVGTSRPSGTDIVLQKLNVSFGRRETERLARQLVLLANPFEDTAGFHPILLTAEFQDLEKKVTDFYFDQAHFHLQAKLNSNGEAEACVLDWKDKVIWQASDVDLSRKRYKTVQATFDLWVFLLDAKSFSSRSATLSEVREWLSVVGGVHLYHRGLRVRPYGDPGHDWLEMNLARAKSPEERPSTNTSIGRVVVDDLHSTLIQKTDRIGFIENTAFSELKRFATDAVEWMAKRRLTEAEERRKQRRLQSERSVKKQEEKIKRFIDKEVSRPKGVLLKKAVERYERAVSKEAQSLREDLQLYRSLATAGITSAVFAHESAKPVTQIEKLADIIQRRSQRLLAAKYDKELGKPLNLLRRSAMALRSYALLPIYLLKRDKRKIDNVAIHEVIESVIELFRPFLDEEKITVEGDLVEGRPLIKGTVALIEAILANLITNAINAFNSEGAPSSKRKLLIRSEISGSVLLIKALDNGPGIINIALDEIWLPGRTTTPGGTGFGLTIVRDAATDLSGRAYALAKGELGGAEITVELPIVEI